MYPAENEEPDLVQHLGVVFEPQHYPRHLYEFFPVDHALASRKRRLRTLTGAALMTPRDVFESAGGFHEAYVNGGEDIDLCLHVGALGFELACVPESRVYHLTSKTPGRNDFEQHNATVLKERCVDMICPDMHLVAAAEGYEVRLTDWLRPYLTLPQRRKELLARRLPKNGADALNEMLWREPLWHAGRRHLITLYEAAGDTRRAMRQAFFLTKHYQSPEAFAALDRLAGEQGDASMTSYARANIRWFTTNVRQSGPAAARYMAEYMARLGEKRLAGHYRDWLSRHGAGAESSIPS
jgi:hypothetical protein